MGLEPAALFQCMTFALLYSGLGNEEELNLEASTCGELMRIKVLDPSGDALMTVIGRSHEELGEQFALACLRHIDIPRLRELHETKLQDTQQTMKRIN